MAGGSSCCAARFAWADPGSEPKKNRMDQPAPTWISVPVAFCLGALFGVASTLLALRIFLPMLGEHWDVQLFVILFSLPVGLGVLVGCGRLFVGIDKGEYASDDWPVSKNAVMVTSAVFSGAVLLSTFA